MKVCSVPGCPNLTATNKCADHKPKDRRPSSAQRGYSSPWQRLRVTYLAKHKTCESEGCTRLATDVDHIDGLGPLGPRGFDTSNLRALCHSCHSQRTAQDQPGGWNNSR